MGRLAIRKVIYDGDNYHYESPYLNDGLNILVGQNGNGKSTFTNLIYFGLGGIVPEFDKNSYNKDPKHTEIYEDENNLVKLIIEINNSKYVLERYFKENFIFVTDLSTEETQEYRVYRTNGSEIFSDWILEKLGIEVFEITQGTKNWKINFKDLMRLIYYDQNTPIDNIYKDLVRNNFLIDSLSFRKAIFEILMGKNYNKYYEYLGEYKRKLKEKDARKDSLKMFTSFRDEVIEVDTANLIHLNNKKNNYIKDIKKLEALREDSKAINNTPGKILNDIEFKRTELLDLEDKEDNILENINIKKNNLDNLLYLNKDLNNEIKKLEKIKFLHDKLSLFSPNTCPYCLKTVEREEGKCICGSTIKEDEYEKFFYTKDEYLDMILSKKKSLESLNFAIEQTEEEIMELNNRLDNINNKKSNLKKEIQNISKEIYSSYNSEKIKGIDDKIRNLNKKLDKIEQAIEIEKKRESINADLDQIQKELDKIKNKVDEYEVKANDDIIEKRNLFSDIYKDYMMKVDKDCLTARIDNDYMPEINNGQYRENSASVHKRLMYFFTLLNMSINYNTNHPQFLLIDTPRKEGIDTSNLINSLEQIESFYNISSKNEFQIILTTSYETYPEKFEDNIVIKLSDDNKLLNKNN